MRSNSSRICEPVPTISRPPSSILCVCVCALLLSFVDSIHQFPTLPYLFLDFFLFYRRPTNLTAVQDPSHLVCGRVQYNNDVISPFRFLHRRYIAPSAVVFFGWTGLHQANEVIGRILSFFNLLNKRRASPAGLANKKKKKKKTTSVHFYKR